MYLQKVTKQAEKKCVKKLVFAGILKVNDEISRIRIQDPNPDPLVRGMDPRIRIRIHTKMSWIRNTVENTADRKMMPGVSACCINVENLFVDGDECGAPTKALQIQVSHLRVTYTIQHTFKQQNLKIIRVQI
jgi:hypothetical protein